MAPVIGLSEQYTTRPAGTTVVTTTTAAPTTPSTASLTSLPGAVYFSNMDSPRLRPCRQIDIRRAIPRAGSGRRRQ